MDEDNDPLKFVGLPAVFQDGAVSFECSGLIGAGRNCSVMWPQRSSVQKDIVSLMSFPKHWWLLVAMEEMCRISAD